MHVRVPALLIAVSALSCGAGAAPIDVGPHPGPVLQRYAQVASREMGRRFGVQPEGLAVRVVPATRGWRIRPRPRGVLVEAADELLAVQGLGAALRRMQLEGGKLVYRGGPVSVIPMVELRGIYGPAHFKNAYEKMSTAELGELFENWALWGANATWNWVDPMPLVDPFSSKPGAAASLAYTRRVLASLGAAQEAGLEIGMTLGTNLVWFDQFRDHPELRAQMGERLIYGQLLCPSLPAGRAIILNNTRNLLREAQHMGLRIASLAFYARDPSGCSDERCRPWHKTSVVLSRDIVGAAREVYPQLRGDLVSWYWTPEETREGVALLGAAPGDWLRFWFHHFPTWAREPRFPDVSFPASVKLGAMYNLSASDSDVYGAAGAITRFRYLQRLMSQFPQNRVQGLHGYTEGIYDDLNKVVALQLLVEPGRPVREIVEEYCRWYFGTTREQTVELAGLIVAMDDLHASAPQLPAMVDRLLAIEKTLPAWGRDWRFTQLRLRAQLARITMEILDGLPPHGAEAGAPAPLDFKRTIGPKVRERMHRALACSTVPDVQNAVWEGYQYLTEKNLLARRRAVLSHELMHASKVDADQTVGLDNIYLGDWPVWWLDQHFRYYKVLGAKTVEAQHKLIQELWP